MEEEPSIESFPSELISNEPGFLEQIECEGRSRAVKQVSGLLRRHENLEKLPHIILRTAKKKASIDAMFHSAMTTQLENVKHGLDAFIPALENVEEVKETYSEISSTLETVPELVQRLSELQEESKKYAQLKVAMQNINQIINLQENVKKANSLIDEEKLLEAHEIISDMESAQEAVLLEMKDCGNKNAQDQEIFDSYFKDFKDVLSRFEQEVGYILRGCFNVVRREPEKLVSAVRIVEREEKFDDLLRLQQKKTGFLPPNRPKAYRNMFLEKLKQGILEKVEGNQLESREENKMWLVRHLEVIRIVMLEDLLIAKKFLVNCFPPEQNIFQYCLSLYHEAVTTQILSLKNQGLEGNEYVSLLQWILQVYPSKQLLGNDQLDLEPDLIPSILSEEEVEELIDVYLTNMSENYAAWMNNTIKQEQEEWLGDTKPEEDLNSCYYTSTPVLINRFFLGYFDQAHEYFQNG